MARRTWGPSSGSLLGEPAKNGGWFACVSPAMRARRAVPTRAAFPSRSRRDADDVGHVVVRRLDRDSKTNARSIALSSMTRRNRAMCAAARRAARLALPAATTYHGGSPASVALAPAAAAGVPFFCSSPRTPPRGSRRGASSCAWLPCSPRPSCGARRRPRSSGRRRDGPRTSRAAPSRRRAPLRRFRRRPRRRKRQTRTPPSSRGSLRPRRAGGAALGTRGRRRAGVPVRSGLNGGARPAAWFGAVGPVARRVAGDADAASGRRRGKNETFRFFVVRLGAGVRADAALVGGTPAPLAASATGDAQTRSAFGFGVTYAALHGYTRRFGFENVSRRRFVASGSRRAGGGETERDAGDALSSSRPAAPVGGGAVLWLYGSGFRNGVTEPPQFEPSAGFAFVSSTKETTVDTGDELRRRASARASRFRRRSPRARRPASRFRRDARARFVPFAEGTIVEGFVEGVALRLDGASLAVAAPTSVSRVAPEAVSAGGGAAGSARPRRRASAHWLRLRLRRAGGRPVRGGGARHAFVRRARARAQPRPRREEPEL